LGLMRGSTWNGQPARLCIFGRVAQLVEQGIENPRVGGSIPSPATMWNKDLGHPRGWPFSWLTPL
jgi:hypothetical protein